MVLPPLSEAKPTCRGCAYYTTMLFRHTPDIRFELMIYTWWMSPMKWDRKSRASVKLSKNKKKEENMWGRWKMKELVWISFEGTLWRRCSCSVVGKKLCGIIVDGSCNASSFHSIFVLAVPFKTPKQTKPHKKTWLKIFSLLCFADYGKKTHCCIGRNKHQECWCSGEEKTNGIWTWHGQPKHTSLTDLLVQIQVTALSLPWLQRHPT